MSSAIFRITQEAGVDTQLGTDPFIDSSFFSEGRIGTSAYNNEPVFIIAGRRSDGYPEARWKLLYAKKQQIGFVLFTEKFSFYGTGNVAEVRDFGNGIFMLKIVVASAVTSIGGGPFTMMQRNGVGRDTSGNSDDDSITFSDVTKMRGMKIGKWALKKAWDHFF
jgi:hypothetical protein